MKADEEKAVAKAKAIQEEYDFAMDVPGDDPKVTALHCVKYWDILSTKHYVFNLLWPALKKLDWTEEVSTSRNLMLGSVFVPSWAQDRFERAGKDPESLVQNRDFFVSKNDVRGGNDSKNNATYLMYTCTYICAYIHVTLRPLLCYSSPYRLHL